MALVDFATGDKANMGGLNDISLISYFCRKCGNGIIVRDPKMSRPNTYTGLIVPTKIGKCVKSVYQVLCFLTSR